MEPRILRLNISGQPIEWLNWQEAVVLVARDMVVWTLGESVRSVFGGVSRLTGRRSQISLPSILACSGSRIARPRSHYPLINRTLFARDRYLCMYCGKPFPEHQLTRDHIVPKSRGGQDRWENVVAACRRCNQYKGNRLLEEIDMGLLALPFRPNQAEYLALQNDRRILADQMEFLSSQFSRNYRADNLRGCPALDA
jgi:5-methylcytosine-specific restriction endonuclease McrA